MEWNYENVQNYIIPYPKHGQLDEWREGMEDEATSDAEECNWLPDDGPDSVVAEAPDDIASNGEPDKSSSSSSERHRSSSSAAGGVGFVVIVIVVFAMVLVICYFVGVLVDQPSSSSSQLIK